jgi:hypothetical protein
MEALLLKPPFFRFHERAKAAYLAKRGPRPETTARLEAVSAHAKKTERGMKKPPPG